MEINLDRNHHTLGSIDWCRFKALQIGIHNNSKQSDVCIEWHSQIVEYRTVDVFVNWTESSFGS